jgi:hypothetical protein
MRKPYGKAHTLSSAPRETVEETLQHPDFLSDLLAIENEARTLGLSELISWAEELKNAELRILRGERLSVVEITGLRKRVAAFAPQAESTLAEVCCA